MVCLLHILQRTGGVHSLFLWCSYYWICSLLCFALWTIVGLFVLFIVAVVSSSFNLRLLSTSLVCSKFSSLTTNSENWVKYISWQYIWRYTVYDKIDIVTVSITTMLSIVVMPNDWKDQTTSKHILKSSNYQFIVNQTRLRRIHWNSMSWFIP